MDCVLFREQYSELADGFLDEAAEISMIRHMAECESCRRMDAGYRAGSRALRSLPALDVGGDFHDKLQARIMAAIEAEAEPAFAGRSRRRQAGALALLAVMIAAGWQVADRPIRPAAEQPQGFLMSLTRDTTFAWPGSLPMMPLAGDTFRTAASPAPSFQIAVDYMIVR